MYIIYINSMAADVSFVPGLLLHKNANTNGPTRCLVGRLIYGSVVTTTLYHCCCSCTGCQCQNEWHSNCASWCIAVHGIGPEYFSEDFRLVSEIYSRQRLRSASSNDVVVRATRRSSLGDRAFPVAGARAWNALPPSVTSVTSAPSLSSFRRLMKTFLFQRQRRR